MSMQLSSWAIRRPIPTIVLFLVLAIAGWTSFLGLPINANPRVDFPVVTVAVPQVGARPPNWNTPSRCGWSAPSPAWPASATSRPRWPTAFPSRRWNSSWA